MKIIYLIKDLISVNLSLNEKINNRHHSQIHIFLQMWKSLIINLAYRD